MDLLYEMSMKNFDLIIIGGGPIGIACAIEAKKANLSYLIIEKGCLVNSLYHYPVNMQFFSSSELLELDKIPFISKENKPKRSEALEYYRRVVTTHSLSIHLFETVLAATKNENGLFNVQTSKNIYTSKNIIVATGFYDIPNLLHVEGETLPKVSHYYTDPHYYAGMNVIVVGASNSSVDAALECYRKDAKVTMVIRDKEISSHVKYWVKPDIENRISEGSIQALYNSSIKSITEKSVIIDTPKGVLNLPNDFVLALTGYRPNFKFLEQLGVHISADQNFTPSYNSETLETNVDNLYLAGVVCGGLNTHTWFIENSRVHASTILSHIVSKS